MVRAENNVGGLYKYTPLPSSRFYRRTDGIFLRTLASSGPGDADPSVSPSLCLWAQQSTASGSPSCPGQGDERISRTFREMMSLCSGFTDGWL